ncbi:hypothetical protein CHS0354_023778 [Potamilus streckersoni]|uniref:Radical SAM core domain-containing protein n=1 Tax=Potamilus streckersoni TaxID=2493646 RepID=A0AAE0VLF6_9BIVA|nr:hypothetical protein CHS0354_023778 [Potamilus streckersoni]
MSHLLNQTSNQEIPQNKDHASAHEKSIGETKTAEPNRFSVTDESEDVQWKRLLRESIQTPEQLHDLFGENLDEMKVLEKEFNIRVNPYYASLIKEKNDAIYKQVIPDSMELIKGCCVDDPLSEERDSPVQSITHRYPDRVLFLVAHECAIYCRFCTRKRKVSDASKISLKYLKAGIDYIANHPEVRDIVISGGDPLTLADSRIEYILKSLREIPHVEIIRIGTKIPCVLPQRITKKLVNIIKKYHPVYVNTHFNHPSELTVEAKLACDRLADAGVPIGNQTVLLKGVNDSVEIMRDLMKGLLKMRVRPYYIYQADLVKGTEHFRTDVEKGLEIIRGLRGHISGLAVPHYVIDAPGGGGKIPLLPHYLQSIDEEKVVLRNFNGEVFVYDQPLDVNLMQIANQNNVMLKTVVDGAKTVVDGAKTVVDGAKTVVDGAKTVVDGAKTVVDGAKTVVDGAKTVVDGAKTVVDGAKTVVDGAKTVVDGAKTVVDGAKTVVDGAKTAVDGVKPNGYGG